MKIFFFVMLFIANAADARMPAPQKASKNLFPTKISFEKMAQTNLGNATREIASAQKVLKQMGQGSMSPPMREFNKQFSSINKPENLDSFIAGMDKNYDAYPSDLQLLTALLQPMRALKGFYWRSTKVLNRRFQQTILGPYDYSFLNEKALPYPVSKNWPLGKEYFSLKLKNHALFSLEQDAQEYLARIVYPELAKAYERIAAMNFSIDTYIWDKEFPLFQDALFLSGQDRFHVMVESDRFAILAKLHELMYRIAMGVAYNNELLLYFQARVEQKNDIYLWDTFTRIGSIKVDKEKEELMLDKYGTRFLLNESGSMWTARAYKHLYGWAGFVNAARKETPNYATFFSGLTGKDEQESFYSTLWKLVNDVHVPNFPSINTIYQTPTHDCKELFYRKSGPEMKQIFGSSVVLREMFGILF